MTRKKSSDKIQIFALVSVAIFISANSAASQECAADADCGDGEYCKWDAYYEMCQDPEPDQEWACETMPFEPSGWCFLIADRCETDDDCAQNFTCNKESFGMGATCAAPADPESDMPECDARSVEYESENGNCEPGPIDCETDSDCPSPLTCVESPRNTTCSVSSNGESDCTDEPVEKYCEYDPPSCESNADCEEGSECVEAGESIDCSDIDIAIDGVDTAEPLPADAGVPEEELPATPACPEGDDECENTDGGADGAAPDVEPEVIPIMPECETHTVKICFPKRVDCTDDDSCAAGETCTDFSELNYAPSWWEDGETAMACMPDGLVMALEGHTSRGIDDSSGGGTMIDMGAVPASSNQSGSEIGVDSDEGVKNVDEEGENADEGDDNADQGEETIGMDSENEAEANDESQESSDGGCSIARRNGTSSSSWLLLIASVLGMRLIRRRRS